MIVAQEIKNFHEIDGHEKYPAPGEAQRAIERFPSLRGPYETAKRDAPRLRGEARRALATAEAAMAAIVEEKSRHRRVPFRELDADRDGSLSLGEFTAIANRHFKETSAIEGWDRYYRPLDADGDGTVTSAQYLGANPGGQKNFDWADRDHDGRVQIAELVSAYSVLNARTAESTFNSRDVDGNGQLSEREFDDDAFVQAFRIEEMRRRIRDAGGELRF